MNNPKYMDLLYWNRVQGFLLCVGACACVFLVIDSSSKGTLFYMSSDEHMRIL